MIDFELNIKHTHCVVIIVLTVVAAGSILTTFAHIYEWPYIWQLIYVVQFKMS